MKSLNANEKKKLRELKRLRSLIQMGEVTGDLEKVQEEIKVLRGEVIAAPMPKSEYKPLTDEEIEKSFAIYKELAIKGTTQKVMAKEMNISLHRLNYLVRKWRKDEAYMKDIREITNRLSENAKLYLKYKKMVKKNLTEKEILFVLDITPSRFEKEKLIWINQKKL